LNKQLLLALLLLFTVLFSVSAISASEVSVTDSHTASLVDDTTDVSVPMEKTADSSVLSVSSDSNVDNDSSKVSLSSEEVLGSENSNTLSTNSDSNSLSATDGVTTGASSESDVSSTANSIVSKDITKYYKGSTPYSATFYDDNGNVLAGRNVKITVNDIAYTVKTNSKGVASLGIHEKPGTFTIVSTNPVTGFKKTNTFKILSTINAEDISKVAADKKKFNATFLDSNGKPLANQKISFSIDDGAVYNRITDSNGVAYVALSDLEGGYHKITLYNADGLTKKYTIKVYNKVETKFITRLHVLYIGDSQVLKTRLLNAFDYAPPAGKTITLTINGKTYTATTDSDGYATFKLSGLTAGTYTASYKFAGGTHYKASTGSNKVYVLPSKDLSLTVKSTKTFGIGSGSSFKVALTSGDVPLSNKKITFTVNGKSQIVTTDSNGIASLPIKLASGSYTIKYAFNGATNLAAVSGSTKITVKERSETRILWKSVTKFTEGTLTFKVALKTPTGTPIAKKVISLTVNGKSYTATTNADGLATFSVSLTPGTYTVTYKFNSTGDENYAGRTGTTQVTVSKKSTLTNGYGYWLFGGDMKSVSLSSLASQGTTDIFLNFYAITKHGQSAVESWIASANKLGIRVHIWMQAFYDGSWINPVSGGSPNTAYFTKVINEAKSYAKIKGVAGIHFDYLRYPGTAYKTSGGTAAITQFVKQATSALHGVNSDLIVSCAIMPETTSNVYYYGQDFAQISKYMDLVVPMIYKGNYGKSSSWITSTSKWFADNSNGAKVWAGLQGYVSDDDVTKLSQSAMKTDAQAALSGKATGVIIFRWGLTSYIDFKSLSSSSSSSSSSSGVTIAQVAAAANSLVSSLKSVDSIPSTVSVGGTSYSAPRFLYLMTKAVEYIDAGKSSSTKISPVSANGAENPSGISGTASLSKANYLDVAKRVSNFIVSYGQAPNYAGSTVGNIKYQALVAGFASVLASYNVNGKLPSTMTVNSVVKPSQSASEPSTPQQEESSSESSSNVKSLSFKNIIAGANTVKTYYASNGKLPASVTLAGIEFSMPEFFYLMSKAINNLENSSASAVAIIYGVKEPTSPSGDNIGSADLDKDGYFRLARLAAHYVEVKNRPPDYISTTFGNVIYSELADAFSRILVFYNSNDNYLPNYVTLRYSDGTTPVDPIYVTGSGLNEKNRVTDLTPYLQSSTNCQVNNSKIKAVVNTLTAGLTTDYDKAVAIYNYVRDQISYSFYYDTRYGSVGTLDAKTGNCVDQAHLVIAMYRTAGLAARYVHGTCYFSSGSTYGHVWAQVLIDDMWVVTDPTSSRNSFGKVVNWNTNSFSIHSITSGISF